MATVTKPTAAPASKSAGTVHTVKVSKNGLTVQAYRGDCMTLLAFDLDKSKLTNFAGFSIHVTPPGQKGYYLFNKLGFSDEVLGKSKITATGSARYTMDNAPLQMFRWVHTPGTNHNINDLILGNYIYAVTPRYLVNDVLQPLDSKLTVQLTIDLNRFVSGKIQTGFTRGFIESQAFTRHFGLNNATRPNKTDLLFDINQNAGPLAKDKKQYPDLKEYTYADVHQWLGWQARVIVMEFITEAQSSKDYSLDVFAFDLNEPVVCQALLTLAAQPGRLRIILDNSATHNAPADFETMFEEQYKKQAHDTATLVRGHFQSLAHTKVFILKKKGKPVKVLTGSTNFSTNGLYINANHVLVFNDPAVAKLYEQVFENSYSLQLMKAFDTTDLAKQPILFSGNGLPKLCFHFSPHDKASATALFNTISERINKAKSDVLFAIMNDHANSSILDAVQNQVKSDKVFTYGITDTIGNKDEISLYKPDSKAGIRVAGKPGSFLLPPPFTPEAKIPGISIHHKFIVVDFKGSDPVVYCGSSNLAFTPEQNNGDNLIEIHDAGLATVFAIEAIRLVDHFQFFNRLSLAGKTDKPDTLYLHGTKESDWVSKYYDKNDLLCATRELLVK